MPVLRQIIQAAAKKNLLVLKGGAAQDFGKFDS